MPTRQVFRFSSILLLTVAITGCAAAAPFSVMTPALQLMGEEDAHLHESPPQAMEALDGVPLQTRVDNTMAAYREELDRARAAQGGFLNSTLNVLSLLLPISGTAASIALSDPDQVQTVAIVTGAATTAVLGVNLLFKPGAKASAAAQCESFLESALEAYERRWGADPTVVGSPEEWSTYLTMRATLEPARLAACGP